MLKMALLLSMLATEASAPPAEPAQPEIAVIVLTSGQHMAVRSYRVDGRVIYIVGADGEPLVVKTDLVDLDASQAATEKKRRLETAAQEKREQEQAAAAEARRQAADRNAAHRAHSKGHGNVWIAPETESAPADGIEGDSPGSEEPLTERPRGRESRGDAKQRSKMISEYNQLVEQYNELAKAWASPMAPHAQLRVEIKDVKAKMDALRAQIRESRSADEK